MKISIAATDDELIRCYPIMAELRPHLSETEFIEQTHRQQRDGFQIVYLEDKNQIVSVAGFRILEYLGWGKTLYVDDLVTVSAARSRRHGGRLFDWLVEHATSRDCDQLHLDSGVQRHAAHRFYLQRRMDITCHHFALKLKR
jgi:GNAT superfamily N-acetyltransferase